MAAVRAPSLMALADRIEAGVTRDRKLIAQADRLDASMLQSESAPRFEPEIHDDHCERIVVRAEGQVIGSWRVLAPRNMRRARAYRAERDFDLALLIVLRERMVEVDRPGIHPQYPFDLVNAHLWAALARYLIDNRYDHVLATAGVGLLDGGHVAASVHQMACMRYMSPEDYRVYPHERLPLESLSVNRPLALTALFRSYLDHGAWICGEPALVRDHGCADFPLLLPLARMKHARDARDFLQKAS